MNNKITKYELEIYFRYCCESGLFIRNIGRGKTKKGDIAGYTRKDGRVMLHINHKLYQASRMAWLYVYGYIPELEIDHINGNPSDNRIDNLRIATHLQNQQNRRSPSIKNKLKVLGVSRSGKKYRASISIFGKYKHLGQFDTIEQAHNAYLIAKRNLHEFCTI